MKEDQNNPPPSQQMNASRAFDEWCKDRDLIRASLRDAFEAGFAAAPPQSRVAGPPEYLCYDLDFEYRDKYGDARTLNHTYTAEHPAASVRAAGAFWNERHKNLPGVFSILLCCKIHPVLIGPITDGRIINGVGLPFFEYKCDTAGMPQNEYFAMKANQLERNRT